MYIFIYIYIDIFLLGNWEFGSKYIGNWKMRMFCSFCPFPLDPGMIYITHIWLMFMVNVGKNYHTCTRPSNIQTNTNNLQGNMYFFVSALVYMFAKTCVTLCSQLLIKIQIWPHIQQNSTEGSPRRVIIRLLWQSEASCSRQRLHSWKSSKVLVSSVKNLLVQPDFMIQLVAIRQGPYAAASSQNVEYLHSSLNKNTLQENAEE